jgi:phosphoribosylamine--glycine ligase
MSAASPRLRVLVLGSGAREHALATRLAASEKVGEVIVAPGNGGTEREHTNAAIASLEDPVAVVALAKEHAPDLVVIGPEAPLVAGVANALREAGFAVFGPGRDGARLEGSKSFFKMFATRHHLPTADFELFTDPKAAHAYVDASTKKLVVKADGLCAGKGVVVAADKAEAHQAIEDMLVARVFGQAGACIVIEEQLAGEEASVHFLTDGRGYLVLPAAQDHKRIFDGDKGPNTGGMGAYAPAALVTEAIAEKIRTRIVEPTVHGLATDGVDFREPMLLEYNVRFGDPETEVLMAVLDEDVPHLLMSVAKGELREAGAAKADGFAAAVVMAAASYPGKPRVGDAISGLEEASRVDGVFVLHAGTKRSGDRVETNGGRVLAVTAHDESLERAIGNAYEAVGKIAFEGAQWRRDIGKREMERRRRNAS